MLASKRETMLRRKSQGKRPFGREWIPPAPPLKPAQLFRRSLKTDTIEPRFDDSTSWQLLRIARLSVLIAVTHDP